MSYTSNSEPDTVVARLTAEVERLTVLCQPRCAGCDQQTHLQHGGGVHWCDECVVQMRERIAELEQMKMPMGDLSPDQQARAWSSVWKVLEELGIYSFVPDRFDGLGVTRAVEFIRTMGERAEVLGTLLRRWFDSESQIGKYDTVVGPSALLAETERVLAQTKETRG